MAITFVDNSAAVKYSIENITQSALEEIACEIESRAIMNTRVATGNTKDKWSHKTLELKAIIGNTEENAIWEEFGTGEYALNGNGRKGKWYVHIGEGKNDISLQTATKYHFKIIEGKNGDKFAVVHGKKPRRALYRAFTQSKATIESTFKTKFKEL